MQLSYREVSNYSPYVSVFTEEQQQSILNNLPREAILEELFLLPWEEVRLDANNFDRLLAAFINKVEEEENYNLANVMIEKAANILTTQRLFQKVKFFYEKLEIHLK